MQRYNYYLIYARKNAIIFNNTYIFIKLLLNFCRSWAKIRLFCVRGVSLRAWACRVPFVVSCEGSGREGLAQREGVGLSVDETTTAGRGRVVCRSCASCEGVPFVGVRCLGVFLRELGALMKRQRPHGSGVSVWGVGLGVWITTTTAGREGQP